MKLVPCLGCQRHVRCDEGACPFCGLALTCSSKAGPAAAVILAAGLALTGCPESPKPPQVVLYGAPPTKNIAPVASQAPTAPPTTPAPKYGAPPVEGDQPK